MTDEHHVTRLSSHEISRHAGRIAGLQPPDCGELRQRLTADEKRMGGLARS